MDFRQQAEWAVLNRVNDPAGRPSQIQGQIKAPGTVLIVNRNGVVFDGASQVNVRNLVAAAGRISDEQFRDRGLYARRARNPASPTRWARSRSGRARASTRTRGSVTQGGGYVLLLAAGAQRRRDQHAARAALAAGDSFIIRRGVGTSENTLSTTRGNEIARAWRRTRTAWRATPA